MKHATLTNAVRRALYTPVERQYLNWELTLYYFHCTKEDVHSSTGGRVDRNYVKMLRDASYEELRWFFKR